MKKIISMLLVLVMALGLLAACGEITNKTPEDPKVEVPATALEILEKTYGKYTEEEKAFPVAGGAGDNMNWEGPGKVDMTANGTDLSFIVYVPEAEVANLTDAATMQHAMNANTFTAAALRVKEGTDAKAFAKTMKDAILGTQWMCGFPEKLVIATVGDYVVMCFGKAGVEDPSFNLVADFVTALTTAYPTATVAVEEAIG